jgi:hypothetical protein
MKFRDREMDREKKIHRVVKGADKSKKHKKSLYDYVEEDYYEDVIEEDYEDFEEVDSKRFSK